MPDYPILKGAQRLSSLGLVTASTQGTSVSAGTANTKGSYVQLVASTAHSADSVLVILNTDGSAQRYLVDIAVGGAGSETPIIRDLGIYGGGSADYGLSIFQLPITIPAGARLSARSQSGTTGAAIRVEVILLQDDMRSTAGLGYVDALGVVSASTTGTTIDPGATTANTKGAWTQLVASTSRTYRQLIFANVQLSTQAATVLYYIDVGIGAAASERVIFPDLYMIAGNTRVSKPQVYPPIPRVIPAGSRISMRAQCTITGAQRTFDAILYGVG